MSTPERIAVSAISAVLLAACTTTSDAPGPVPTRGPGLGQRAPAELVAAWDISIPPNGAGLPAGSGSVSDGAKVYAAKCQSCHGEKGVGKPADRLAGGAGSLGSGNAVMTVGSYWPYATTLFDYVRRAMPSTAPMTLTNEEVYAVSAYVLYLNGIIREDQVMNAQTLPQVRMPNRDGFIDMSRK